jgi:hypothetical protein
VAVFEAPERAAQCAAGGRDGSVGEQRKALGEVLADEVAALDGVMRLGGKGGEHGGLVPDAAGGSELTEVVGEQAGGVLTRVRGVEAAFELDEMRGEIHRDRGVVGKEQRKAPISFQV